MKGDEARLAELLVVFIQNIKEDPFNKLLKICQPVALSLAHKYFYEGFELEDILQESRKVLVRAVSEYKIQEGMPFLQFYHMSLKNHLNMLVRREKAYKRKINSETYSLDEMIENAGEYVRGTSSVMTNPEEATIVSELFEEYVVGLSPFERDVFQLFLKGTSVEESASLLNCTETQVKNAWYRCGSKLKDVIE